MIQSNDAFAFRFGLHFLVRFKCRMHTCMRAYVNVKCFCADLLKLFYQYEADISTLSTKLLLYSLVPLVLHSSAFWTTVTADV